VLGGGWDSNRVVAQAGAPRADGGRLGGSETTRFGRLARQLSDGLLDHEDLVWSTGDHLCASPASTRSGRSSDPSAFYEARDHFRETLRVVTLNRMTCVRDFYVLPSGKVLHKRA
jgi:hypothetical protein